MGCFSYLCNECGKPILSDSFQGEAVRLYLLQDSEVIESMRGEYDSYGRVFDINRESVEWTSMNWAEAVHMHFNKSKCCGFAAIHERCFTGELPEIISKNDPNQGWGYDENTKWG